MTGRAILECPVDVLWDVIWDVIWMSHRCVVWGCHMGRHPGRLPEITRAELPPRAPGCLIMVQQIIPAFGCWRARLLATAAGLWAAASPEVHAQSPFQIVWVEIGEASSGSDEYPTHAGRQLFMASDLLSKSLANVKVERVDVEPVIHHLSVGEQLCVSRMRIRALGPGREEVGGAPLSISVRQDQRQRLGLKRSKRDICMQPIEAGEYPMRLTSMLPALDGTMRGAQVYIRVKARELPDAPPASSND
jgi:hypothetical protein